MRSRLVPLLLAALAVPAAAAAQAPLRGSALAVELRGELAVPTSAFEDRYDLGTGFGFGIAAKYPVAPILALYAGWDRFEFDGTPGDAGVEVVDRGFRVGAQLGLPEPIGGLDPFVTAGVTYNRATLEVRDEAGTTEVEDGRSPGYEVGAGVMVPVARGVWLVPEGRYRLRSADLPIASLGDGDVRIRYLAFNLGVVIRLPGRDADPPR